MRAVLQGYRVIYTEQRPKETHDRCIKCHRMSLLGDGLCKRCWDRAEVILPKLHRTVQPTKNYTVSILEGT
jgi:predicted amidophosphoribosyltransferase